jgi:ABC-2 type transport system ATP-binding protein
MPVISAEKLSKTFGKVRAVDDVSIDVPESQIYGIIGPDGAGKTTFFRMVTTLLIPDSGHLSVLNLDAVKDFRKIRPRLGYMPGRFSLYMDLTVEENLRFFGQIFKADYKKNYDLIKDIYSQIEPFKNRLAGKLSGGMKQKLALSCALIHKPDLLILDEPTTGVDAVSRREFWEMLRKLKEQGLSIIVSTPYMDEAALCDRISLMQGGRMLMTESPEGIVRSFPGKLYSFRHLKKYELLKRMKEYQNHLNIYPFGDELHYIDRSPVADLPGIKNYLTGFGLEPEIHETIPTIEDTFIYLMNQPH